MRIILIKQQHFEEEVLQEEEYREFLVVKSSRDQTVFCKQMIYFEVRILHQIFEEEMKGSYRIQ